MRELGQIILAEDEKTYKQCLLYKNQRIKLYSVYIRSPWVNRQVYVLDYDKDSAIGQARCACGIATYQIPESMEPLIECYAIPQDLVITGWGKTQW